MKAKHGTTIIGLFGLLLLFSSCVNQKEGLSKKVFEKYEVVESFFLYDTARGLPIIFELKRDVFGNLLCEANSWVAFDDPIEFCEKWKQKY